MNNHNTTKQSINNVLIPIETTYRELLYKVYLCHQLAVKGFRCYLGRKSYINYLIRNLKGYIYVDKGYHQGVSEKIYEAVRQNNGIIINLDEEGGIDYYDGSIITNRYPKTLFENADLALMWGNQQYELVKNNMNKKNKVAVSGHPRFELLKPEFHYFYEDEVNKIIKKLTTPKSILIGAFMISLSILFTNGFNFSITPEAKAQDSDGMYLLQLKLDMVTTMLEISNVNLKEINANTSDTVMLLRRFK